MNLCIECEQEQDGRWLAEVPQLPGVFVYGATVEEAKTKIELLAQRVLAERIQAGSSKVNDLLITNQLAPCARQKTAYAGRNERSELRRMSCCRSMGYAAARRNPSYMYSSRPDGRSRRLLV